MNAMSLKQTAALGLLCDGVRREQNGCEAGQDDELDGAVRAKKELGVLALDSRFGPSWNDDGSLPCSPRDSLSCTPEDSPESSLDDFNSIAALEEDTRTLLTDLYREHAGLTGTRSTTEHVAMETMRRVVAGVMKKHSMAYNGMMQRLCLEEQDDNMALVSAVAESMFTDGGCNWGRVVSLVAFGAELSVRLKRAGREHCVDAVATQVAAHLTSHHHRWLLNNNTWAGFVEFFRVCDPEGAVRNTLLTLVGVAGVGAWLALLMR